MHKASAILLGAAALAAPLRAQSSVDTAGAGTLIAEALERSEVMENLRHLSDVIGRASRARPPCGARTSGLRSGSGATGWRRPWRRSISA